MKYQYLLICLLILSCKPVQQTTTIPKPFSISHTEENLRFTPEEQILKIKNELSITITPVNARILDTISLLSSVFFDGDYSKKLTTVFEETKSVTPQKTNPEDEIYRIVDEMNKDGKFSETIKENLKQTISQNGVLEKLKAADTEDASMSGANPYKIDNGHYYSLFKLTFINQSNEIQKINIDNIMLSSGVEQLYALKSSFFENKCKDNPNQLSIAQRLNMPDVLVLPPNSQVQKYLAFQPLNPYLKQFEVQIINEKSLLGSAKYDVEMSSISKIIDFVPFTLNTSIHHSLIKGQYYAIESPDDYKVDKNTLFLQKDKLQEEIVIYGIIRSPSPSNAYLFEYILVSSGYIKPANIQGNKIEFKEVLRYLY